MTLKTPGLYKHLATTSLLLLCFLSVIHGLPPNVSPNFDCDYSVWNLYQQTPPDQWATSLRGNAILTASTAAPSTCRHCWWNLGYPPVNPIVFTAGLNCTQFIVELYMAFWNGNNLTYPDFQKLFFSAHAKQVLPTAFQASNGWLLPDFITNNMDMDGDNLISLNEFQVGMHFWAPLVWSQSGPAVTPTVAQTLGGFYYDQSSWAIWLGQSKRTAESWAYYYDNNGAKSSWLLNLRSASAEEAAESFAFRDIDFSGKISLHEHYFQLWADSNADGYISRTEFDVSLYWSRAVGNTSAAFAQHDTNQDNRISLIERKFFVSDTQKVEKLTNDQWISGDFPGNEFRLHDTDSDGYISRMEIAQYESYFVCTANLQGSSSYWNNDQCVIDVVMYAESPYDAANLNVWTSIVAQLGWTIHSTTALSSLGDVIAALNAAEKQQLQINRFVNQSLAIVSTADPSFNAYACSNSITLYDGLQIMVLTNPPIISLEALVPLLIISPSFLQFMCVIFLTVLCTGHLFYFAERRRNQEQFSKVYVAGVLDGLYYSMVTVLTIGYGDKVPKTGLGKTFGVIWMFIGIIVFSIFTGQITSDISARQAQGLIASMTDLTGMTIAILDTKLGGIDVSQRYAFSPITYKTMDAAAQALLNNEVNAVVAPRHLVVSFWSAWQQKGNCLNTFTLAGPIFEPSSMNKICALQTVGYLGRYLINNINQAIQAVSSNGYIAQLSGDLSPSQDPSAAQECQQSDQYPVTLFIGVACIVFVLSVAAVAIEMKIKQYRRRKREQEAQKILRHIKEYRDNRVQRFALHWLKTTRANKDKRMAMTVLAQMKQVITTAVAQHPSQKVTPEQLRELSFVHGLNEDPRPLSIVERETEYPFLSPTRTGPDPVLPIMLEMKSTLEEMKLVLETAGSSVHVLQEGALTNRRQLGNIVVFFAFFNFAAFIVLIVFTIVLLVVGY